jgi:hypothetical protein
VPAQLVDLLIYASNMHPTLDIFPTGSVDQFHLPLSSTPQLSRISDLDEQFASGALPDQNTQQLTPIHDAPPPQHSPIESPGYTATVDLPHYESMIVNALQAINNPNGSPPKDIWEWMNKYSPGVCGV